VRPPRPAEVESVRPGSAAARAGIRPGDRVLRVDGRAPRDYIHYRYLAADEKVTLTVQDRSGQRRRAVLSKALDEDPGMRFTRDVFDGIRTCRNRCRFCFVDQLPEGLRPALYVRDDDYRLSFLHGNFITLTNLSPADRARIARLHLSPLYVSVHATEPEVRAKLFGTRTPDVLAEMKRLTAKAIEFHTQIVVCPGVNDGVHLERTARDLAALHPGVQSVGVVPVGLTRHRRRLPKVLAVGKSLAAEILSQVRGWQREFLKQLGTRLVFAADELYLLAGRPIPGRAHYESFPQLSNGIGGARLFLDRVRRMRPLKLRRRVRATLVTGEAAGELAGALAKKLAEGGRVQAEVNVVRNRLLGSSVTTAGLLAGRDIARALRGRKPGGIVIVPAAALGAVGEFLDGMTLQQLERKVGARVLACDSPREVAAALRRLDAGRSSP
jgi:putative radical SAM enzyme (TIGR03279 family)